VEAITRSQSSIDYGLENGIIDSGAAFPDPEIIGRADFVVLAMYPQTLVDWVEQNQRYFKPGALITDVTGVKTCVVAPVQAMLRQDVEFIAAHPMAGRETLGVQNADESIFRGANYIVTPTDKNTPEAITLCEQLGHILGFARVTRLSVAEHDRAIAFLSQLTHAIAVSLMCCTEDEEEVSRLSSLTGDSFRDLTRIAKINDAMWSELFLSNREPLLEQMDTFLERFSEMRAALAEGDVDKMRAMMRRSTDNRRAFDRQAK
jgi:prephenate dehydrogenase